MNRREFAQRAASLVAAGWLWTGCKGSGDTPPAVVDPRDAARQAVLAAALARLLPGDPGHDWPSASEARVQDYLARALQRPEIASAGSLVRMGLDHLDGAARRTAPGGFVALDAAGQDTLLRSFQTGSARVGRFDTARFFEVLLTLALEGYLGDPRHGGNAGAKAWMASGVTMACPRRP